MRITENLSRVFILSQMTSAQRSRKGSLVYMRLDADGLKTAPAGQSPVLCQLKINLNCSPIVHIIETRLEVIS